MASTNGSGQSFGQQAWIVALMAAAVIVPAAIFQGVVMLVVQNGEGNVAPNEPEIVQVAPPIIEVADGDQPEADEPVADVEEPADGAAEPMDETEAPAESPDKIAADGPEGDGMEAPVEQPADGGEQAGMAESPAEDEPTDEPADEAPAEPADASTAQPTGPSPAELLKQAEAGDTAAMHQLALAYRDGTNVPRDQVSALAWLTVADAMGDDTAAALRDELREKLTDEDTAAAHEISIELLDQLAEANKPK